MGISGNREIINIEIDYTPLKKLYQQGVAFAGICDKTVGRFVHDNSANLAKYTGIASAVLGVYNNKLTPLHLLLNVATVISLAELSQKQRIDGEKLTEGEKKAARAGASNLLIGNVTTLVGARWIGALSLIHQLCSEYIKVKRG